MTRERAEKEIRTIFTEPWADGIIKALEQEPRPRWISCQRAVPEKYGNYLVTVESSDGTAAITFQMVDHFGPGWLHEDKLHKVSAWMPLPEPYSEAEQ